MLLMGLALALFVFKVSFSTGVYAWQTPGFGILFPHAPGPKLSLRVNGRTYSYLMGNSPGYLRLPDFDAIFFVQERPGGSAECHLVFLNGGRDLDFGGIAERLGFEIGDKSSNIRSRKISGSELEISFDDDGRIIAYVFNLTTGTTSKSRDKN